MTTAQTLGPLRPNGKPEWAGTPCKFCQLRLVRDDQRDRGDLADARAVARRFGALQPTRPCSPQRTRGARLIPTGLSARCQALPSSLAPRSSSLSIACGEVPRPFVGSAYGGETAAPNCPPRTGPRFAVMNSRWPREGVLLARLKASAAIGTARRDQARVVSLRDAI